MNDLETTDLALSDDGQMLVGMDGEPKTINNLDCFFQDIKNEAITQEGEIFYDDTYGWSLMDFIHVEYDELIKLEIEQRIKEKLLKGDVIDEKSIVTRIMNIEQRISIRVSFKFIQSDMEYNLDLNVDGSEVMSDD